MARLHSTAAAMLLLAATCVPAFGQPRESEKTVFDHAAKAWAVGTMKLGRPLKYRQGRLHAFTGRIIDLIAAAKGEPRNFMLILEVPENEADNPLLKEGDEVLAPLDLLPEHSYWRDNLPHTPRHAIAGGRRNVFRGDEIPEARRVLESFLTANRKKGKERVPAEIEAVAAALETPIGRLREDAVQFLVSRLVVATQVPEAARPILVRYLSGAAPAAERIRLIGAIGESGAQGFAADLQAIAKGNDEVAVAAGSAAEALREAQPALRLTVMSRSGSHELQAYAAERLGRLAGRDKVALARATELLASGHPDQVRAAAAAGLGAATGAVAVAPLTEALRKGDAASRAAAAGLARIGGAEATAVLEKALAEGRGETAIAAATGLRQVRGCQSCARVLAEQHQQHPDPGVRDAIAKVLATSIEQERESAK